MKRRLSQALTVRGSADFASVDAYQQCIDRIVARLNRRVASRLGQEQAVLQPLPDVGFAACTELVVRVTRSATIEVRRVLYSVPSRLVGTRLRVQLYQDRLVGYLGTTRVVTLPRLHARGQQRLRRVDYRHVIHGLAAKPQAFRYSRLRDDLFCRMTVTGACGASLTTPCRPERPINGWSGYCASPRTTIAKPP